MQHLHIILKFSIILYAFRLGFPNRRAVEIGPGVSDDLCEFVRCCGGYHRRDIRKRNTPNAMNAARRVSIFFYQYLLLLFFV
jgi:hypothetical protein